MRVRDRFLNVALLVKAVLVVADLLELIIAVMVAAHERQVG